MEPHLFAGSTFYGHAGGADNYGSWLTHQPEEKLTVAYMTNAKVHPVPDIVRGVIDIYYNRPFQIPTFETLAISADVRDRYVGVYASPDVPVKFTVTRQGSTLFVPPANQEAAHGHQMARARLPRVRQRGRRARRRPRRQSGTRPVCRALLRR